MSEIRRKVLKIMKSYGGKLIEIPYTKGVSSSALINHLNEISVTPDIRRSLLNWPIQSHGAEILRKALIDLTDENFEAEVIKAGKPVIVDFWAEWCGPCKQIGPILEEISNEMSDVVIAKHNIDNEPNTPTKYGIRGIPTMLLFSGGELKATKVGATTKSNIVSWIKENT